MKSLKKINRLPLIIGSFDSLHLGHKKLFNKAGNKFNILLIWTGLTKGKYLNNLTERIKNLDSTNYENLFVFDITKNNFCAKKFIEEYLIMINPSKIIVGSDFKFGKGLDGNINLLKQYFKVVTIKYNPQYQTNKIKQLYELGKINKANILLNHDITFIGKSIQGKQEGRKLGFPTINIVLDRKNKIILLNGIYAGECIINNRSYKSAICIYKNNNNKQLIEIHCLNTKIKNNFYGKNIIFKLNKFINKFIYVNNTKQLKNIIQYNIELVNKYFDTTF